MGCRRQRRDRNENAEIAKPMLVGIELGAEVSTRELSIPARCIQATFRKRLGVRRDYAGLYRSVLIATRLIEYRENRSLDR